MSYIKGHILTVSREIGPCYNTCKMEIVLSQNSFNQFNIINDILNSGGLIFICKDPEKSNIIKTKPETFRCISCGAYLEKYENKCQFCDTQHSWKRREK